MINQEMYDLGAAPNEIRATFNYSLQRKAEIGEDKVFDFSIGNPSVPAPNKVVEVATELLAQPSLKVHGYSASPGILSVREAVAAHLKKTFGIDAKANQVYMTSGASSAIAISFKAVSNPGDEIITIAPYFTEYKTWAEACGCTLVEVDANQETFQMDISAIEAAINEKTSAIIINTPNNPTGVIYPEEDLVALADLLTKKEEELGHPIYLVSDEPYREITYGKKVAFVPSLYKDTIICYSFSKSLSLPGERIGYIYVSDNIENASEVSTAVSGAGRALGYICATVFFQQIAAACLDEPVNVDAYAENRELLKSILDECGYEYLEPDGAFYMWVRALGGDDVAFTKKAREHELLVVPASCFKGKGWVRMSYCIASETIKNAAPALRALKEEYSL